MTTVVSVQALVINVVMRVMGSNDLWTFNRGTVKRGQLIDGKLISWTHDHADT